MTVTTTAIPNGWTADQPWLSVAWLSTLNAGSLNFMQELIPRGEDLTPFNVDTVAQGEDVNPFQVNTVARGTKTVGYYVNHAARAMREEAYQVIHVARGEEVVPFQVNHVPRATKTVGYYVNTVARGVKANAYQVTHVAKREDVNRFQVNTVARGERAVPFSQVQLARGVSPLNISYFIAIYNTDKFRVLYEFASDGITLNNFLASSATSVDKGVLNLKNDIVEKYWEATGDVDEWFQFDCGAGRAPGLDTIGLVGHNLSNGAQVNVYGYGTSADPVPPDIVWASVPLYTSMPMPLDRPQEKNLIWIAPSIPLVGFRHWRVTISDPANADGKIRVGRFVAGRSFVLAAENFEQDLQFDLVNFKDEMNLNGFTSISNNRALKKRLKLTFKNLEIVNKGNYKRFRQFSEYARDTLKSLVIPDPKDPYTYAVFAKLASMPTETHRAVSVTNRLANFELTWDEAR